MAADVGKKVKVQVSFTDDRGHVETVTSDATATVTGNDNDTGPALSIADASANENDGYLMFEVTLSRSLRNTVKVDFETISGGTATEGVDYWPHDYTHVIPAGETTTQMGFALIEDTVDAAGETVKVRLSNARVVNAYGDKKKDLDITRAEATGTINAPSTTTTTVPNLTIRIQDATGSEDNGWLVFKVKLSRTYDDYVCYDFEAISGGTATEGTDYLKLPKATYWMQIGKKVDEPFVRIIDDSVNDDGETVKVKISNARLCDDSSRTLSITRAEATGTISNTGTTLMYSSDDGDGDDALLAKSVAALQTFALYANYPNPFNAETQMTYALPEAGAVELAIYNVGGQRVRTLVQGEQAAGRYQIVWDGRNDTGAGLASGVYLSRLTSTQGVRVRRLLLIK